MVSATKDHLLGCCYLVWIAVMGWSVSRECNDEAGTEATSVGGVPAREVIEEELPRMPHAIFVSCVLPFESNFLPLLQLGLFLRVCDREALRFRPLTLETCPSLLSE